MWENLKTNYLINQKGQAILELATFGSIVLFCLALLVQFGIQMNYQQNMQMQAFRKALKLAYYKQGMNSQATLIMTKDKPVVNPSDRWGFADRTPISGSASLTWSNTLNEEYVSEIPPDLGIIGPPNPANLPDYRDMPRIYYDIDQDTNGGIGLAKSEINDNLDKSGIGTEQKGVFTSANYNWRTDVQSLYYIGTYIENSNHTTGQKEYVPVLLNPRQDIKVFADPQDLQQKYAAYRVGNGLTRTLSNAVLISSDAEKEAFLSGKGRGVDIIAVKGDPNKEDCPNNECGVLTQILYIDSRLGKIDPYYTDVKPWDKDKTLKDRQGLLITDYTKKMDYGASGAKITTTETNTGISTSTESSASQTITHKIKLNDGTVREVPVTFNPNLPYNYKVSHE